MCDYSLHHVANRPAKIEDKLVATKFHNSITRGFAAVGQLNVAVLLPGTEIAFDECVGCKPSRSASASCRTEDWAAARALPASQYGQPRGPSRCAGNSRRAGGTSHALVRWPARDCATIAGRVACRNCGGDRRRTPASRVLVFDLIAQRIRANRRCDTKNHRLCRWLASRLAIAVPQPCRPILEHSISVCCIPPQAFHLWL